MPVPAIFYAHRCESPLKSTNQVGQFYNMTFQNGGHDRGKWPGRSLSGNEIEVPNRRDRRKKSPGVSASINGEIRDFRWRSNSLRSAYKIAGCVAGFSFGEFKVQTFARKTTLASSGL